MSEQWQTACWAIGLIWGAGSISVAFGHLDSGWGSTPAQHRGTLAIITAWPIVITVILARGVWRCAAWLVSDLKRPAKPPVDDPRAGYRDSAKEPRA